MLVFFIGPSRGDMREELGLNSSSAAPSLEFQCPQSETRDEGKVYFKE